MSNVYFSTQLGEEIIVIHPGEWVVSSTHPVTTSLGSCVAVVLYSQSEKIGGMNHFMITHPGKILISESTKSARYGIHAMELLINSLIKNNIPRSSLSAAIFGGGQMFEEHHYNGHSGMIGERNAAFAREFLAAEKIPVMLDRAGGVGGQKVIFFPKTGKIQVKKIRTLFRVREEEAEYAAELNSAERRNRSNIRLF